MEAKEGVSAARLRISKARRQAISVSVMPGFRTAPRGGKAGGGGGWCGGGRGGRSGQGGGGGGGGGGGAGEWRGSGGWGSWGFGRDWGEYKGRGKGWIVGGEAWRLTTGQKETPRRGAG